ncbi:MAG: AraC family transcriptional regulator [Bacteroidia bacterium]|nr:AraC family transcriptional regulator [Bacteroidia bacterium]
MIHQAHHIQPPLDQYIEAIFYFKNFSPEHSIERVVPTGRVFIIFEFDGITRGTYDNETLEPKGSFEKVWIAGQHKSYLSISAHQDSEMLAIQFKPYGAYPIFHQPMHQFNDQILPAEEVLGQEIINLHAQLMEVEEAKEKLVGVENWLKQRLDQDKSSPPELILLIENLQTKAVSELSSLVNQYPKTQKHLIDQFKKFVGLTPKYFQRIVRFNEILQRIHKNEKIEWSQIAYQCEFADQSHFIKEFKHFSGINPQKFIKKDLHKGDTNFFKIGPEC